VIKSKRIRRAVYVACMGKRRVTYRVWWGNLREKCKYSFGTFAELHKVSTRFVMLVCLHGKTQLPLDEFSLSLISVYFQKSVKKIQVSIKSDKHKRYFT
jgi:hypothetical protein